VEGTLWMDRRFYSYAVLENTMILPLT